jgi:hypothetical protein
VYQTVISSEVKQWTEIALCFREIIHLKIFLNRVIEYDEEFILQQVSMQEKNVMPYRIEEKITGKIITHSDSDSVP